MTTLVPLTDEEVEVAEALAEAFTVSVEALEDPTVVDAARFEAAYTVDSLFRQRLEANMQFLVEHGYASRANPDIPRQFNIEDVTLLDGPPGTRAHVTVCVVDTAITYEPETGGVVNDDVGAARARYDLVIEDGTWQLYEAYNMTELLYGEMECPPAE